MADTLRDSYAVPCHAPRLIMARRLPVSNLGAVVNALIWLLSVTALLALFLWIYSS